MEWIPIKKNKKSILIDDIFHFLLTLYLLDICTFSGLLSLWYWFLQNLNPKTRTLRSLRTPNFTFIELEKLSNHMQFNLLVTIFHYISTANKGQSTVYLSCNDHCDRWLCQEIFFLLMLFLFPRNSFKWSWTCFPGI